VAVRNDGDTTAFSGTLPILSAVFSNPTPKASMADVAATGLVEALHGRYAIERELGRGGMATVYLARDLKHGRLVAIKVLKPDLSVFLGPERFQRETQIAAGLQHAHILPVFDSGDANGLLWYTMP
jgi:serine/threonine protein kinase